VSDVYSFREGRIPLLVSVPHDGWQIPADILPDMTGTGRGIPDTDWHVSKLYEFASDLGAAMIVANYSRYVVDLNRPADDAALYEGQIATGICPSRTFAGHEIYFEGTAIDIGARIERYWRPYHDKLDAALAEIKEEFGYALLWDAHSIPSRVPRLFDGELPVLNLGTWNQRSCDLSLENAVMAAAQASPYEAVLNARFKGGYITRHYGRPAAHVHAIQLELAQRAYMNEKSLEYDQEKAFPLIQTLTNLLRAFQEAARR
jgi:N-formylglutamate deformylase